MKNLFLYICLLNRYTSKLVKHIFRNISMLFLCAITIPELPAQSFKTYTPIVNDSVKLAAIKKDILQKYLKDSASIKGENKKQLVGFYRDRYQNLSDMFDEKEFLYNTEIDQYLNELVSEIFKGNPQLNRLGTQFLFSRVFWPNAFSTGEGTVVFNVGLFTGLENESQVVSILCHELAHLFQDHMDKAITQYVAVINSKEFQNELKEIKKSKYERNKQLAKLEKGLTFNTRRHGRDHESEADSIGLSYMQNTRYNVKEAITALGLLDNMDKDNYPSDSGLQRHFSFAEKPFNSKWLKQETGFFGGVADKKISNKERDSLKTHPDCKDRAERIRPTVEKIYKPGSRNFVVSETTFKELQNKFKFEIIEYCFQSENISRCLYLAMEMLETNPANAYLVTTIGKCFNEMYSHQKEHTLNRIVNLPSPYFDKNYDILNQFIQNITLGDMASLGYHFLNRYKTQLAGDAGFEKTLATALKNFNLYKN